MRRLRRGEKTAIAPLPGATATIPPPTPLLAGNPTFHAHPPEPSYSPDIIIDDMPGTCAAPFVYDVRQEESWPALAERIIAKHVD